MGWKSIFSLRICKSLSCSQESLSKLRLKSQHRSTHHHHQNLHLLPLVYFLRNHSILQMGIYCLSVLSLSILTADSIVTSNSHLAKQNGNKGPVDGSFNELLEGLRFCIFGSLVMDLALDYWLLILKSEFAGFCFIFETGSIFLTPYISIFQSCFIIL